MTAEYVAESVEREMATREAIRLGDVSPEWLADRLDEQGVVRLRDVFSEDWLDGVRESVFEHIDGRGDGDFFIANPDDEIGSPAHQLMSDPSLLWLLDATAALRRPPAASAQKFQCSIPVRNGTSPKIRSNLFHYDPSVLTMVVPIVIPRAVVGSCGELAAFGNKRPFRRFTATHLVETALTHNPLYRRHLAKKVAKAPDRYLVELQPGDAYVFWGYRQFHGNVACAPGLVRATMVVSFGEVHADSRVLKLAWKFSRSRRDIGRLQCAPATPTSA